MCVNLTASRPLVNISLRPVRSGVGRFVYLTAAQLAHLKTEILRRLAAIRPGGGATNFGITPRWRLEEIRELELLRDRLASFGEVAP